MTIDRFEVPGLGLDKALCEKVLDDLTLNPSTQKGASMCIHPFVPLDDITLAVAPQFPLASAVDDNILRMFSYTFDALFSAQNTEKEGTMIEGSSQNSDDNVR